MEMLEKFKKILQKLQQEHKGEYSVPISILTDIVNGQSLLTKKKKQLLLTETQCNNLIEVIEKYGLAQLDKGNPSAVKILLKENVENKDFSPEDVKPQSNIRKQSVKIVANNTDDFRSKMKVSEEKKQLCERIKKILDTLSQGIVEKEEALRLSLLVAIAGESIFFLGLPGTAKSMVARRLKGAFKSEGNDGIKYFEYLMNQFSTPDELFGPVSLKSLESDEYKRITKGYLPESDVVFLDEIWKANPAIQNTLLTIINEKKFHNGNEIVDVPLKALVAASNELPAQDMGLEALWDRFIVRLMVNPVSEKNFFDVVLDSTANKNISVDDTLAITTKELKDWQEAIDDVVVPDVVQSVITEIRKSLQKENEKSKKDIFYVSDRRWKKIVHLLRTSAFLNGRDEVDLMDCQLISYCIWNNKEQREDVTEIITKCTKENGIEYFNDVEDIENAIKDFDDHITDQFYVKKEDEPFVKVIDNNSCYELKKEISIYSGGDSWSSPRTQCIRYIDKAGQCYSSNEKYLCVVENVGYKNEKIYFVNKYGNGSGGYKSDNHNCEVVMKSENGLEKDKTVFSERYGEIYDLRKKVADKKKEQIEQSFSEAYDKIEKFRSEKESFFDKNLFADPAMKKVIMSKVDDAQVELEKLEEKFNKEVVSRYQK